MIYLFPNHLGSAALAYSKQIISMRRGGGGAGRGVRRSYLSADWDDEKDTPVSK